MVIRMRHNRGQTKSRRSHHALTGPALSVCSQCGAKHRPHHMCQECGYYKGRLVVDVKAEREKRAARIKAKQDMIRAQQEQVAPTEAEEVSEQQPEQSLDDKK